MIATVFGPRIMLLIAEVSSLIRRRAGLSPGQGLAPVVVGGRDNVSAENPAPNAQRSRRCRVGVALPRAERAAA